MSQELTSLDISDSSERETTIKSKEVKYSEEKLEMLKERFTSHEMIILVERTKSLKVITKLEHRTNVELGLNNVYVAIYLNE